MLRKVVPPPSPEMMWSILTPSAANRPFSIATAHGSVAVTRPYWLTAISAAGDGAAWQTTRVATTIERAQRPRSMDVLPMVSAIMSRQLQHRNHRRLHRLVVCGSAPTRLAVIARASGLVGWVERSETRRLN